MTGQWYYEDDSGDKVPIKEDWRSRTYDESPIVIRFVPNPLRQRNPLVRPNNIWIQTPFGAIFATDFPLSGSWSIVSVVRRMKELQHQNQFDFKKFVEIVQIFSTKDQIESKS